MKRNYILDKYRGFTIISMVLFHLLYDINLYINIDWYNNFYINRIWQLSIATSFFIISGITSNFLKSNKNIIRGIKVSLLGFLITLVTFLFVRDQIIVFGVLNGLGISMIISGIIDKYLKINWKFFLLFIVLFVITYNIPNNKFLFIELNSFLYEKNLFFLGFPKDNFYSTDYFPIIPWTFLYISGNLIGKFLINNNFFGFYGKNSTLAKIGQNSLKIYLLHQIIIFLLVYILFRIIL